MHVLNIKQWDRLTEDFSKHLQVCRVSICLALYQPVSLPVLFGSTSNHISNIHWGTTNSLSSSHDFVNLDERNYSLQRDWPALFPYAFRIKRKIPKPTYRTAGCTGEYHLPATETGMEKIHKHTCTSATYPIVQLCT